MLWPPWETVPECSPQIQAWDYLGGYYIVECADLDEALEIASHLPLVPEGAAEVRPIVER